MNNAHRIAIHIAALAAATAMAQTPSVPPLINYQGRLTDASGAGIDGTRHLTFHIYSNAVGEAEAAVWGPQTFNNVPLIDGHFNVILGTTDNGGRSILDAFGSNERFLGIQVNPDAEIVPRQQILSAPYAVQAERSVQSVQAANADHVAGQPISFYMPPGSIISYGGTEAPAGWLLCDGSAISRDAYPSLFTAISTNWGVGDNTTTFNLPDLRGMFLRGAGVHGAQNKAAGGKYDGGRVGAFEWDQFQGHWHASNRTGSPGTNYLLALRSDTHDNVSYNSRVGVRNPIHDNENGTPRVGNETKPASYSVLYIIKY